MYSCFKIQNPATLIYCPISDIILLPRTHQHNNRRDIPMFCRQCFCLYSLGDDILGSWLMFDLGFSILSPLKNAIQPIMLHSVFVWSLTPDYLSTLSLLNFIFFLSEDVFHLSRSFCLLVLTCITLAVSLSLLSSVNLITLLSFQAYKLLKKKNTNKLELDLGQTFELYDVSLFSTKNHMLCNLEQVRGRTDSPPQTPFRWIRWDIEVWVCFSHF